MNERIVKYCPMRGNASDTNITINCIEEECAWWHSGSCDIMSIAESLYALQESLHEINVNH